MAGELAGKKILVVDDDRDIRSAIEIALREFDPEVITAGDGNQAVQRTEADNPDLIILDMMLPKRSGFLVLERLKRDKTKGDPPLVIMITGNLGNRHKMYAEQLGVDCYMRKPFRMEALMKEVVDLLS